MSKPFNQSSVLSASSFKLNQKEVQGDLSFKQIPDTCAKDIEDIFYAVLGNPVAHSLSPVIHQLFAEQTQQKILYSAIHVEVGGLVKALDDFQARGGKGVNITSPFKQEAFALVNAMSQRAQVAHAINTIKFTEEGERWGDNTDGIGLIRDLSFNLNMNLKGKRILLLGAGGAAKSVLGPLLAARPDGIVIANRTTNKAQALAESFSEMGNVRACSLATLTHFSFDVVIHATSAGLQSETFLLPDAVLTNAVCYDMAYGKAALPFLQQAKKQGARAIYDGIGMLVEQAAESFYLWRNVKPETVSVVKSVKQYESREL